MARMVYDKWFHGDWLRDTIPLSIAAKGAWMVLLASAFDAPERGKLVHDIDTLARMFGTSVAEAESLLDEISRKRVGDITRDGDIYTVMSRRQMREEAEREADRVRKQSGRDSDPVPDAFRRDSGEIPNDFRGVSGDIPEARSHTPKPTPPTPQGGGGGEDEPEPTDGAQGFPEPLWEAFRAREAFGLGNIGYREVRGLTLYELGHLLDTVRDLGVRKPVAVARRRSREGPPPKASLHLVRAWLYPPPERCGCGGEIRRELSGGTSQTWHVCAACGKSWPGK